MFSWIDPKDCRPSTNTTVWAMIFNPTNKDGHSDYTGYAYLDGNGVWHSDEPKDDGETPLWVDVKYWVPLSKMNEVRAETPKREVPDTSHIGDAEIIEEKHIYTIKYPSGRTYIKTTTIRKNADGDRVAECTIVPKK